MVPSPAALAGSEDQARHTAPIPLGECLMMQMCDNAKRFSAACIDKTADHGLCAMPDGRTVQSDTENNSLKAVRVPL